MTTIAIHQPNYIPWAGYFYKIKLCDIFVFLDDVQFSKNGFINRNRIKTPQGASWLTVPVHHKTEYSIQETLLVNNNWKTKHLKTLRGAYSRCPYFEEIFDFFSGLLTESTALNIADLNIEIVIAIAQKLGLECSFQKSSELKIEEKNDDRLVQIVTKLGGDIYLSGHGGSKYQSIEKFASSGIELKYYDFASPQYTQIWGEFVSKLTIIDILFNHGFSETLLLLQTSKN